ncbi:hypothetical protein GJA_434 [Janthinobacterium agaricidamnosum NBRC 102515 = DSM 9628]|uniref:Uncharacterized protein n=2 Tax=Janthinobacterium agaricidamnosum TaxID=55508 RepID=W0UX49_9BURK|nr:hypothetical protein GJA_434 [Janthinobacterium agaricidamnosum NBRC 102515 = DSM 9628]
MQRTPRSGLHDATALLPPRVRQAAARYRRDGATLQALPRRRG